MNIYDSIKSQIWPCMIPTLREDIAKRALQGLLSDPTNREAERKPGETCAQATARQAVEYADALIDELRK